MDAPIDVFFGRFSAIISETIVPDELNKRIVSEPDDILKFVWRLFPVKAKIAGGSIPELLGTEKTADKTTEKHVPVIEEIEGGFKVTVGSTLHPMTDEHFIEWIELNLPSVSSKLQKMEKKHKPKSLHKLFIKSKKYRGGSYKRASKRSNKTKKYKSEYTKIYKNTTFRV